MQFYCEPYFSSIERWRHGDHLLLANRIGTIDTAEKIFQEYSQNGETFEFDLVYDHPEVPLLDEVIPTPGKTFSFGGDQTSFAAARSLVPEKIFNRCGLFFQNMLLKPMSGNSDAYLESANNETRKTIIAAIEKLFRLPENAGKCRFVFRNLSENGGQGKFRNYPASALSEAAKSFIEYLLEQTKLEEPNKKRKQPASAMGGSSNKPTQSNPNKKPRLSKPKKAANDDEEAELESLNGQETAEDGDGEPLEEVDNWVTTHPSVGNEVAAHFPVADETTGKMKKALFKGKVTQYAPASSARAKDQLYHVEWEDGDQQDYDEKEYQKALALFKENYSFVRSDHPSIGRKVAAYFDVPMSGTKGKKATTVKQLYQGKVTGFCPAANNGQDSEDEDLYHITWQDGDEEDYDPKDLELGEALYKENFEKVEDLTGEDEGEGDKEKTKKAVEEKPEEVTMEIDEEVEKEIQSILDDERNEQQQKEKEQQQKKDHHHHHSHHGHPMPPVSLEEEMKSIEVPVHHTSVTTEEEEEEEEEEGKPTEEQQPPAAESPKKSTRNSSSSQMKSPAATEEKKDTKKKSNTKLKEEVNEEEEVKDAKSKITTTKKEKSTPSSSSSASKKKQKQPEPEPEEEEEGDDWTTDHPAVGGRVASYFPVPGKKKGKKQLFAGEITRYGPETKQGANDQLYHVIWEDGDEEDYEEKEYQEAKKRYDEDYESDKKKNQGGGEDANEKSPTKKQQKNSKKNSNNSEKKSSEDDQEVEILTVHQSKEEQQEQQEEQEEEEPVHSTTADDNVHTNDHENHHHHHNNNNNKLHEATLENLETVPIGFNEMEENPMKATGEQEEEKHSNHKHDNQNHNHTQSHSGNNNTQHNISLIDTLPFGADEGMVDESTHNLNHSNSQVSQLQE
jgi:hypothetical protein